MVSQEEIDLYNLLKDLPDFECFPIPTTWFKHFGIPPRNPITVKEFISSNYTANCATARKELPPLRINKPQQNGKLVDVKPTEVINIEIKTTPFILEEGEEFPYILPSLMEQNVAPVESQD